MKTLFAAVIALLTGLATTERTPAATLEPKRTVAFSCRAGASILAVIRKSYRLIYEWRRSGRVELAVEGGIVASTGYSGGGATQAVFRRGPWTYVVFERSVRTGFSGRNDSASDAGVDVLRNGRRIDTRRCDDPDSHFSTTALRGIREGSFLDY